MAVNEQATIGELVTGAPAIYPRPITLTGRYVTLVPLDPDVHSKDIYELMKNEKERLFRYLKEPPNDQDDHKQRMINNVNSTEKVFFAVINNVTKQAVGITDYTRIDPDHRCLEGGYVYTPALQRTIGGTEVMYLMAKHVFEDLGYRRYEWKCNALNANSRSAAIRQGFVFEGVFRQHMIINGRNVDTAWYSMIDKEWPKRKEAFERWLSPDNFDSNGQQKVSLSSINNLDQSK